MCVHMCVYTHRYTYFHGKTVTSCCFQYKLTLHWEGWSCIGQNERICCSLLQTSRAVGGGRKNNCQWSLKLPCLPFVTVSQSIILILCSHESFIKNWPINLQDNGPPSLPPFLSFLAQIKQLVWYSSHMWEVGRCKVVFLGWVLCIFKAFSFYIRETLLKYIFSFGAEKRLH